MIYPLYLEVVCSKILFLYCYIRPFLIFLLKNVSYHRLVILFYFLCLFMRGYMGLCLYFAP